MTVYEYVFWFVSGTTTLAALVFLAAEALRK